MWGRCDAPTLPFVAVRRFGGQGCSLVQYLTGSTQVFGLGRQNLTRAADPLRGQHQPNCTASDESSASLATRTTTHTRTEQLATTRSGRPGAASGMARGAR